MNDLRTRLPELLGQGEMLSRQEAEVILARGDELLPQIILLMERSVTHCWTGAVLLGALGDPRAIPTLLRLLESGNQVLDELACESLSRLGEPALEALQTRWDYLSTVSLGQLGQFHPQLRSRVCARLVELLASEWGVVAAYALVDNGWLEAVPAVQSSMQSPTWDLESFSQSDLESWLRGTYPSQSPTRDPLHHLAPPHRLELHRFLLDLAAAVAAQWASPEFRERFHRELEELRPRPEAARLAQVGRNDPCPCGSGRKYKKCCLEADLALARPGPLEARLQSLTWEPSGYRLTPREQLATLTPDELFEHLDILRLPTAADLRRRLEGETRDFMLWAGASRYQALGRVKEACDMALTVALSDQGHPALNYAEISSLAGIDLQRRPSLLGMILNRGFLDEALHYAQAELQRDPETGLRAFEEIWRHHPQPLWTAAAAAAATPYGAAGQVLPPLERALEQARRGQSRGHYLLPDRPCPEWVLADFCQELREALSREVRLQVLLEESRTQPVSESLALRLAELRDREWELSRSRPPDLAEQLARVQGQAALVLGEILASQMPERRRAVLAAQHEGLLLWVTPGPAAEAPRAQEYDVLEVETDLALRALLRTAGESGQASLRVILGSWGGWAALAVAGTDEEFAELAAIALSEVGSELPLGEQWQVVGMDWAHALALGGTDAEAFLNQARGGPASPQEPEEPPVGILQVYLKRVLHRLLRQGKVGAAHTDLGYFFRGLPPQWRGALKQVLDLMVSDGYVRLKPTLTGPHISLEPRRLSALKRYLETGQIPPGKLVGYFE